VRRGIIIDTTQAAEEPVVLVVRNALDDESDFIRDSWRKSYSHSPFAVRAGTRYWQRQSAVIDYCRRTGVTLVATTEQEPDTALGYLVGSAPGNVVHWVYVKHDARRLGVARGLVTALGVQHARYTHKPWDKLRTGLDALGWVYQPLRPEEMA
jgi:hypothetical protein